ncbi:MAG TPA: hypothetical protein VFJ46_17545 [Xanthobacteraceae bacterium]|nr:hypothetical protein [Xanthobacteraceae bacterium]
MTTPARKKAHIVKSFTDAGTGESFKAGDQPLLDPGAFENYKAAGLARVPDATSAPAKPKGAAKSRPSSSRKPAARPATAKSSTAKAPPAPSGETAPSA